MRDLLLRKVLHPQAHDNYRVVLKDDGLEVEIDSIGDQWPDDLKLCDRILRLSDPQRAMMAPKDYVERVAPQHRAKLYVGWCREFISDTHMLI